MFFGFCFSCLKKRLCCNCLHFFNYNIALSYKALLTRTRNILSMRSNFWSFFRDVLPALVAVSLTPKALFPHCLHEPLLGDEARHWLKPSRCNHNSVYLFLLFKRQSFSVSFVNVFYVGTAACEKLTAILLAPRGKNKPLIPHFAN